MKNYKELIVWQKGIELAVEIYRIIDLFPSKEKYALSNQMQRAVISISSNIAEGWGRGTTKEYIYFLHIARGSLMELETQIIIAFKLKYIDQNSYNKVSDLIKSIAMMLNKLISKLKMKLDLRLKER